MNELHLNTATMIEILQMWIDMDMPIDKPKVTSFKASDTSHSGGPVFIVQLDSDKAPSKC